MAYRFTNTEKWNDAWFSELTPPTKLLFLYLCDQCDIAGFLEINAKKISFDSGIGKQEVEKSLGRLGNRLLFSADKKYLFIRNFIKHQKNTPLNEKNNAHAGIISRLKENMQIFDIKDINDYFTSPLLGADEGLNSPYGKGNGKGNGKNGGVQGGIPEKTKFEKFNDWLSENCESVSKMEKQMTKDQFAVISEKYSSREIMKVIQEMDNWKKNGYPVNKLRKSVFQTFNSWNK